MNMPLPDSIANKPGITAGLDIYWQAFTDLNTSRELGMAEGPIPWTAVDQWATRHHIVGEEFDRLVLVLRGIDAAYLKHRSKSSNKTIGKRSKKPFTGKQSIRIK